VVGAWWRDGGEKGLSWLGEVGREQRGGNGVMSSDGGEDRGKGRS
jgi:hypothetical protein